MSDDETKALDPESAYAAQAALSEAIIQMANNVERPLRRIHYPEMPAGVKAVVAGVVADTVGQISRARASVGAIARAIKDKTYDLVPHDDLSKLPWYYEYAPNVISLTWATTASGYLPNGQGGNVGLNVGLISDADGVHFMATPSASTGVGVPGAGISSHPMVGGSYDADEATDARGPFETVSGGVGAGEIGIDGSYATGTADGKPVHFFEAGGGPAAETPSANINISPGTNHTYVSGGWNYRDWLS